MVRTAHPTRSRGIEAPMVRMAHPTRSRGIEAVGAHGAPSGKAQAGETIVPVVHLHSYLY